MSRIVGIRKTRNLSAEPEIKQLNQKQVTHQMKTHFRYMLVLSNDKIGRRGETTKSLNEKPGSNEDF